MSFSNLGLTQVLQETVASLGYTEPTPIQQKAIPAVLEGRDIMGGAQTGTGKTAAFALPLLQRFSGNKRRPGRKPRVLVLAPTRELALQVNDSFKAYGQDMPVRSIPVFGGVKINGQIIELKKGCDVVVATPGRLLDHLNQGTISLKEIEVLVLDEADRMLDMGFIHDIKKVLRALPTQRQNLLFSATYSPEIKRLADKLLKSPEMIEVARRNTAAETVAQTVYRVEKNRKLALIHYLVKQNNWYQVLVFSRTKHGAQRMAKKLDKRGVPSAAIHGDKTQNARVKALNAFKKGDVQVLVATDIAARGIDIDQLACVINHDLPNVAEDYVHRIGRTGRAGAEGCAISLVSGEETKLLKAIERLIKRQIPVEALPDFPDLAPLGPPPRKKTEGQTGQSGVQGDRNRSQNRGGRQGGPKRPPRTASSRSGSRNQSRSRGPRREPAAAGARASRD